VGEVKTSCVLRVVSCEWGKEGGGGGLDEFAGVGVPVAAGEDADGLGGFGDGDEGFGDGGEVGVAVLFLAGELGAGGVEERGDGAEVGG